MALEFEKFMFPFSLYAKKRYAYMPWTRPEAPDPISYKGLQIIRRDTCEYTKKLMEEIFIRLLDYKNKDQALNTCKEYVRSELTKFFNGQVNQKDLILTKQLKSTYKIRKNKTAQDVNWLNKDITQPHVKVAHKLREIDPVNCPKPPDRVPFLFIETKKNVLQHEKAIHPDQFEQGKHKIDSIYYFDHQVLKPLKMIFDPIMKNFTALYNDLYYKKINELNGQKEISSFFKTVKRDQKEPERWVDDDSESETDSNSDSDIFEQDQGDYDPMDVN
jgi:DNA polymerase elongation subunit (family B)